MEILQIILSVILIFLIITQSKGTGLGSAWGGGVSYHSKRGMEKTFFYATIIISIAFVAIALINAI